MKRMPLLVGVVSVAMLLGACGGGNPPSPTPDPIPNPSPTPDPSPTPRPGGSYSVTLAPDLLPGRSIPMPEGSGTRPVAAVRGEEGPLSQFVLDEVLLASDDEAAVQSFLNRYGGTVIHKVVPPAGFSGVKTFYDVRIDLSKVEAGNIVQEMQAALGAEVGGRYQVSDAGVLKLLRVIFDERGGGLDLQPNFVSSSQGFFDGSTEGGGQDALAWHDFEDGGKLKIGVKRAWQILEAASKLGNRVKVGVLDRGFNWSSAPDFPEFYWADARLPRANPKEADKPWHGNMVSLTLGGLADNSKGAAGVGAPVVKLALYEHNSVGEIIGQFKNAHNNGDRIINMSFGGWADNGFWGYPGELKHLEDWTKSMWAQGHLLVAAAGNDGLSVDRVKDGKETAWEWPCENQGVVCVGGLEWEKTSRDAGSNYSEGRGETIDLWAPFTTRIGKFDGDGDDNSVYTVSGTSFSSPFVAGVAALVWAANPGLSNVQVWEILQKTAHQDVPGLPRVNAAGAVQEALRLTGENVAPRLRITAPASGLKVLQGSVNLPTTLSASVWDVEPGCCTVTWKSSLDGELGQGTTLPYTFAGRSPGLRTVTATATDAGGKSVSAQITVEVVNKPPTIKVLSPVSGSTFTKGLTVLLRAAPEDDLGINPGQCVWTSSRAGEGPWNGCEVGAVFTTTGLRTLSVRYVDAQNSSSNVASTALTIVDPPPSGPPVISLSIKDRFDPWKPNAHLIWSMVDPGGPGMADIKPYTFVWKLTYDGVTKTIPEPVNWGGRLGEKLILPQDYFTFPDCLWNGDARPIKVTLSITDPEGLTTTKDVTYELNFQQCIG